MGMQTGTATVGKSMAFPQTAKNRTTLQSSDCTTGYLFKKYKKSNSKGYMHPYVYYSIICSSQPKCPLTDEWIKKMCVECVCCVLGVCCVCVVCCVC